MKLVNLADYEKAAGAKMPTIYFDYYASGADDEITLRENHTAYGRLKLHYRVLRGINQVDTTTYLLGQKLSLPILIAPAAFQKLAHPDGEKAMAQAAEQVGTTMILSTVSTTSLEEVAQATSAPLWFQLYMYKDRGITQALIERAAAAGFQAIALTVDTPVFGKRERDIRNQFQLPDHLTIQNLMSSSGERLPAASGSALSTYVNEMFKMDLSWGDVEWLASITSLPIFLKGVVHPADATAALDYGAGGIIVSNHGGRQLDTSPATIEVLPAIAEVLSGRLPLLVDGGIRRGTDVVKALALGADAVCIGRPALWGLAVNGSAGVTAVFDLLREELERAMALCGVKSIAEITPELIF